MGFLVPPNCAHQQKWRNYGYRFNESEQETVERRKNGKFEK